MAHRGVLGGCRFHGVRPPLVPAFVPVHVLAVALDHHHVLHGVAIGGEGLVHCRLQGAGLAAAVRAVRGDHQFCFGVIDPGAERIRREAAEHHRVDGPDPGAGQQGDDGFRDHGEVHGHPVALGHTQGLEGVGGLLYFLGELRVGVGAGVAGFALKIDGNAIAQAVFHVPVQRVVGGVDFASHEPLRERRVGPVQGLGEVLVPGEQFTGLLRPERGPVGGGILVFRAETTASAANSGLGGKVRVSCSRFSKASPCCWPAGAVAVELGVSWDM